MSMTGILRTVLRYVPDALVPGTRPELRAASMARSAPRCRGSTASLKVRGEARFAAEVAMERLLYAAIVHSTIARGRIAALDTAAAEAAPGVALVMTHRNAPRLKPPQAFGEGDGVAGSNLPVMQDDSIHWNGEAGGAWCWPRPRNRPTTRPAWCRSPMTSEPAVTDFAAARAKARYPDSVLGEPAVVAIGDAEKALAAAPHRVDATYTTPILNHNAIELHAVTVDWPDGRLLVHDATQMITSTAGAIARVFGLKPDQIRVLSPFVGGGFGGKGLWSHQILAAAASKLAGRPVRLVLSREGVYRLIGGRTTTEQRVALGAARDGRLDALIHTGIAAMTTHNNVPEQFTFPARHIYAAKSFRLEQKVADMDMLANTFMRAPGESIGTFALESAIDELAHAIGIDPIELRRRWEPERDPTTRLAPFIAPSAQGLCRRRGALRLGAARCRCPGAGATANGFWAWAWPPPPIPTTACRAPGRGCGSTPRAGSPCRPRATRWAWARPRCRRSTPPTGWASGSSRCRSSTATASCRPAPWPAARRRPWARSPRWRRRPTRWSATC